MADPRPVPLDTAASAEVVDAVLTADAAVLPAVRAVAGAIVEAVDLVCGRCAAGGRWLVVGDGAAGRVVTLAVADLPTDFGFADDAVRAVTAAELVALRPTARDVVVVVALGADDAAAQAVELARRARSGLVLVTTADADGLDPDGPAGDAGAGDVRAGDALAAVADVVVRPVVGPEVVRGVVRLAAASAAKLVLDALTTGVAARLGRVHGDLPVDLVADVDHDRERAARMVADLTGLEPAAARASAEAAGFDVRVAVIAHAGGLTTTQAALHASGRRTLRDALAHLPPRLPG